jgi:hypothetical protein
MIVGDLALFSWRRVPAGSVPAWQAHDYVAIIADS